MKLYNFFFNSAGYRVRIALNLKGIAYENIPVDLRQTRTAQRDADYLALNPQGLLPTLIDGDLVITQSMAIVEYIEELYPEPALLPERPAARAKVRAFAQAIACEMHPLNNTGVLHFLEHGLKLDQDQRARWFQQWITRGFTGLEAMAKETRGVGPFAFGAKVTLADVFLVPQWDRARRFPCDLSPYPTLAAIVTHCEALTAFAAAAPERQPGFKSP